MKKISYKPNFCTSSKVEYTSTFDCCLNDFSSDHIALFKDNAKAKYGISFACFASFDASSICSEYLDSETIFTNLNNICLVSKKSAEA